jgi:hypothetical protein
VVGTVARVREEREFFRGAREDVAVSLLLVEPLDRWSTREKDGRRERSGTE